MFRLYPEVEPGMMHIGIDNTARVFVKVFQLLF